YRNPDPTDLNNSWTPLGMNSAPNSCGHGVLRVAVGHPGGAHRARVIVAAQDGCGLWRCTGQGTCTQSSSMVNYTVGANAAGRGGFLWPDHLLPTLYFYAPSQGLFVSSDGGNSWSGPVWPVTSTLDGTGYLASDPTGRYIFASVSGGSSCGADCG